MNEKSNSIAKLIPTSVGEFDIVSAKCTVCGGNTAVAARKGATDEQIKELVAGAKCAKCQQAAILEEMLEESARAQAGMWEKVCPQAFQNTDLTHPDLHKPFVQAALDWKWGPKGLGFMGESGLGKTRCMFLAAKEAFCQGRSVFAIRHTRFSRLVQDAFTGDSRSVPRGTLEKLCEVDVLILDDLGKPPSTERADAELADLLDERIWNERPVLWTVNGTSQWLKDRFGPDRGKPIVRRLTEFSTIISANGSASPASGTKGRRREGAGPRQQTADFGPDGS